MWKKHKLTAIVCSCLLLIICGCATGPVKTSDTSTPHHDRIVAVGDVHGSYEGLVTILREAALIDGANHWTGGNTLLVQVGDLLDRGADVRKVLDLLMSLEGQAASEGGRVVVLLGNHEAMNLVGSFQDVSPDAYKRFESPDSAKKQETAFERWQAFFGASLEAQGTAPEEQKQQWTEKHPPGFVEYTEAMEPDGNYGKWIRSCPAVFRYGGTVFVHAGFSAGYADQTLDTVNQSVRDEIKQYDRIKSLLIEKGAAEPFFTLSEITSVLEAVLAAEEGGALAPSLQKDLPEMKAAKPFLDSFFETSYLMADDGPLWYRGIARSPDEELTSFLPQWLAANNAWRLVVGHTPSADGRILSRLEGSAFIIDTGMLTEYYKNGRSSALEILDDEVTAVYGAGERIPFPSPEIEYESELVWTDEAGSPLPFQDEAEILAFLETAEPLPDPEVIETGVNRPLKKRLEKDGLKVNTIFRHQSEASPPTAMAGSGLDSRYFRDGWEGDICAYEINRLLGLDNMPPTVFRTIDGKKGSLQLWAEQTMQDRQRAQDNTLPPESTPWNRQMWDMRVFDNLINNTDRNQTNILIDGNWRLILIDHTRSFARDKTLPFPQQVIHCSRGLWYSLRHLDETEARKQLAPYLPSGEIDALFVRQKALIQLIRDLIHRNGEENVLF